MQTNVLNFWMLYNRKSFHQYSLNHLLWQNISLIVQTASWTLVQLVVPLFLSITNIDIIQNYCKIKTHHKNDILIVAPVSKIWLCTIVYFWFFLLQTSNTCFFCYFTRVLISFKFFDNINILILLLLLLTIFEEISLSFLSNFLVILYIPWHLPTVNSIINIFIKLHNDIVVYII